MGLTTLSVRPLRYPSCDFAAERNLEMTETTPVMPQFCWSDRLSVNISRVSGTLRARRCTVFISILILAMVFSLMFGHTLSTGK